MQGDFMPDNCSICHGLRATAGKDRVRGDRGEAGRHGLELNPGWPVGRVRVGPARVPRIPRIAMERTAYGRTNASLTRLRGSAQRPKEGKGLDRGFSLRQNLTPNRTARLVISGGSIVTPGATSIMVNPKRKNSVARLKPSSTHRNSHRAELSFSIMEFGTRDSIIRTTLL